MSNRTYRRVLYKVNYEYESEMTTSNHYGEVERTGQKAWTDHEEYIIGPWGSAGPILVQAWVSTRWNGQYRRFEISEAHGIDGEIGGGHY